MTLLPSHSLAAFYRAAQLCDEDDVKLLLQEIPEAHASVAQQLSYLVHDYQFDQIKQLSQKDSTEGSTI